MKLGEERRKEEKGRKQLREEMKGGEAKVKDGNEGREEKKLIKITKKK